MAIIRPNTGMVGNLVLWWCLLGLSVALPSPFIGDDSSEHGVVPGKKSTNCSCGWANKEGSRIVNGEETKVHEFPLIVGIRTIYTKFIFCGGTILTPYHVITAAHCTVDKKEKGIALAVSVAEHDFFDSKETSETKTIEVAETIEHDLYNKKEELEHDIAIMVLKEKIQYNDVVGPACLPSHPVNLVGKVVKVIGWGRLWAGGPPSNVLRKVNLNVVPPKQCDDWFTGVPYKNPRQLCTFTVDKDSCEGDSGGPVVWLDPDTNRYTLVGLVSYGANECAAPGSPGVNTDVYYYKDWILEKIHSSRSGHNTCQKIN